MSKKANKAQQNVDARLVLPAGRPATEAVLAARPDVSAAEVLWVVRAGLEFDEAAELLGVEVADVEAALQLNERHVREFDDLGEPDTLLVKHAKLVNAVNFYAEDSYYLRPPSGVASWIEGDHGYLARKALGRPNEYDREHDAREAKEIEKRLAEIPAEIESGELHDWSEVEKILQRASDELAVRNEATAQAFALVLKRLLMRGSLSDAARWLFTKQPVFDARPIDVLEHEGPKRLLAALDHRK